MDAAQKAVAAVIFRKIWERAPQKVIESAAYAEGDRLGLSRDEVCWVATWVLNQAAMEGTA